jgi:hypothetical protein
MCGLKRIREDLLSVDVTLSASSEARNAYASAQESDAPLRKRAKVNHASTKAAQSKDPRRNKEISRAKFAASKKIRRNKQDTAQSFTDAHTPASTTQDEDQEMRDASAEGQSVYQPGAPRPPPAIALKTTAPAASSSSIALFHHLPPTLASDIPNNKYAPTDPITQRHYLQEVRHLELHPSRTPLQSPNSSVSLQVRRIIYERLFCGKTNDGCVPIYNSYGMKATRGATVSKAFLLGVWKWFDEESVVLPFAGRKDKEKKALKALGLGKENFPSPYEAKMTKEEMRADRPAVPQRRKKGSVEIGDEQVDVSSGSNSEAAVPRSHTPDRGDSVEEGEVSPDCGTNFVAGYFDASSIHERVHAAANTFTSNIKGLVHIRCGNQAFLVKKAALFEHCGFARKHFADPESCKDLKMHDRSPVITRAFIQAISGGNLPYFDIEFANGKDGRDVLGVLDEENCTVRIIAWDIYTCVAMHDLACTMDCSTVKDMVVDSILSLYAEELRCKKKRPGHKVERFELPFTYINHLSPHNDKGLIRLIADIHVDRHLPGNNSAVTWPQEINDHAYDVIEEWMYHSREDLEPVLTSKGRCQRYHVHGDEEPCYEMAARQNTTDAIRNLFTDLHEKALVSHQLALASTDPRTQHARFAVTQWTLRQSERAALALVFIAEHKQAIAWRKARALGTEEWKRGVERLERALEGYRDDYCWVWKYVEEHWGEGRWDGEGDRWTEEEFWKEVRGRGRVVYDEERGDGCERSKERDDIGMMEVCKTTSIHS